MSGLLGFTGLSILLLMSLSVTAQESILEKIFFEAYDKFEEIDREVTRRLAVRSWNDSVQLQKRRCEIFSENDKSYEEVETAALALRDYFRGLDAATDQSKKATVEEQVARYCRPRATALEYFIRLVVAIDRCSPSKNNAEKNEISNFFTNLVNSACNKDGEIIAQFITENGLACLSSKQSALISLINHTGTGDKCSNLTEMQQNVARELASCEGSSSVTLADTLFNVVRIGVPCNGTTTDGNNAL